jgi:hypothetical protein
MPDSKEAKAQWTQPPSMEAETQAQKEAGEEWEIPP